MSRPTLPGEEWRDLYGGLYSVSSRGHVRRNPATVARGNHALSVRGRTLTPWLRKNYAHVTLSVRGATIKAAVHVLVCSAFHGDRPYTGAHVRHLDGDSRNNAATNLAWGTAADNAADKVRHGRQQRGERAACARLTADKVEAMRALYAAGSTYRALSASFGISEQSVADACCGRSWGHIGGAVPSRGHNKTSIRNSYRRSRA